MSGKLAKWQRTCAVCGGVFNMRHESYSGRPPRHWACAYPPTPAGRSASDEATPPEEA